MSSDDKVRVKRGGSIVYKQGGETRSCHRSWYRGKHTDFVASKQNLSERDALEKYVLKGWLPPEPFITRRDYITTFGSCFADHITTALSRRGYRVSREVEGDSKSHVIRQGAGIVNVFALEQQFAWAYENREFDENLWYDSEGELAEATELIREQTKAIFDETSIFILTLGLSEVWCNKQTGDVFWRAIPISKFDPEVHGFRVTTLAETLHCLENIWNIIHTSKPDARVIFTLSPVPLVATFRPVSCMTANEVSKSILRASLDEFLRNHKDMLTKQIFYFPSYEIVRCYADNPYLPDRRHIRKGIIKLIMDAFQKHYCLD